MSVKHLKGGNWLAKGPSIIEGSLQPGSLFSKVVFKITGVVPCARCRDRMSQMNQWGWWKCWRNRKLIASWLSEEARQRGHQITDSNSLDLFKAALKEFRKAKDP